MALLNINALAGFSQALDTLTDWQRAALVEVVFCYRFGVLSATAVFNDADVLCEVAGHIPGTVAKANTRRYGGDLESLAIGEPRFYVDGDEPGALLLGYTYLATGALVEWKRYQRDPDDKYRVLIDRYGSDDRVISVGEVERSAGPELWKGPANLLQKATAAGMHAIFLAELSQAAAFLSRSDLFASGRRRAFNGLYQGAL